MYWDDLIKIKDYYETLTSKENTKKEHAYEEWAVQTLLNRCLDNPDNNPRDILDDMEMDLLIEASSASKNRIAFETARNILVELKEILN